MESVEFNPFIDPLFDTTNRSAIMVAPNEVYFNWAKCVMNENEIAGLSDSEIFLIPPFSTYEEAELFIRNFFDLFFQHELKKWNVSSAYWPVNRNYDLFNKWFEIRICRKVSDIMA